MMSDPDHTSQGARFVTGIGLCMFRDHTSQRVRFVTGIGVCLLRDHTSQGVPFVTGIGPRRVYVPEVVE